jgi:EmrB/QacA subfamily drug resistance transporter
LQQTTAPDRAAFRKWLCFTAIALGTFVGFLDSSIVNIALPTLTRHFQTDLNVIKWVVTSYLLMITGLVIIFGRLADMYGRKRLYIFGLIVFTISSALCGAAPTIWTLILFRCLQGMGAAALLANNTALITETFPGKERGKALGMLGSVLALAAITGPLVGGFLTDLIGWRSIFYVNLPVGIPGIILAAKVLPSQPRHSSGEKFDFLGAITLFACLTSFLFLTNVLSKPEWHPSTFVPLLVATLALAIIFLMIEARVEHALLDLSIFRKWAFTTAVLASFLAFWGIASISFLMPFYLDRVLLLDPTKSGILLAPVPIALAIAAPLGGYLTDRFGVRAICTTGAAINFFGLIVLATLSTTTSTLGVFLRMIPFGVGMGLFQPPNSNAMMGAVPVNRLGIVSGMIGLLKNLGSMTGVTVTSLVSTVTQVAVLNQLNASGVFGAAAERESFASAVRVTFLVSAAVFFVVIVTSIIRGKEAPTTKPLAVEVENA